MNNIRIIVCWKCHEELFSKVDLKCGFCGWLICPHCGACSGEKYENCFGGYIEGRSLTNERRNDYLKIEYNKWPSVQDYCNEEARKSRDKLNGVQSISVEEAHEKQMIINRLYDEYVVGLKVETKKGIEHIESYIEDNYFTYLIVAINDECVKFVYSDAITNGFVSAIV